MRKLIFSQFFVLLFILISACGKQQEPTPQMSDADNTSLTPNSSRELQDPGTVIITYSPSSEIIPNPERGFVHVDETPNHLGEETISNYEQFNLKSLQSYQSSQEGWGGEDYVGPLIIDPPMSLVGRWFNLNDFVDSEISEEYLQNLQADFDTVRAAGMKINVRFAYIGYVSHIDSFGNQIPPFYDADKATILMHLEQLKPLLHANKDVINLVEAGFIGVWGEWAYTDYFGNPWSLKSNEYLDRVEILDAILNAVPAERNVLVRCLQYKQQLSDIDYETRYNTHNPFPDEFAHDGSPISRIGFHNDCFLTNEFDAGTFAFDLNTLQDDKAHLQAETKYVPMGGETCDIGPPIPSGHPSEWDLNIRYLCPTALQELEMFHWTYLNLDWYRGVLNTWRTGVPPHDCFDEIASRLGYRLSLQDGIFTDIVNPGSHFDIHLEIANDGFAAPINPRLVELILRNVESGALFSVFLPHDPRFWLPDENKSYKLDHSICTPEDIPPGEYELLLSLPDPEPALYGRPPYSIRFANEDLWEPKTGFNRLTHSLIVADWATINPCSEDMLLVSNREATPYIELPSLNSAFTLPPQGELTSMEGQVISGSFSIKGNYHGIDSYNSYLTTSIAVLKFESQNTYEVSFDYLILEAPNEGFDVLFYSPIGGDEGNWLATTVISGRSGDSGTAMLRSTLADYSDYRVVWNIIGTGAIAIDNIQITDLTTGEVVAAEDAEQ